MATSTECTSQLESLPDEVLLHIFSYLDYDTLTFGLLQVNYTFSSICREPAFYNVLRVRHHWSYQKFCRVLEDKLVITNTKIIDAREASRHQANPAKAITTLLPTSNVEVLKVASLQCAFAQRLLTAVADSNMFDQLSMIQCEESSGKESYALLHNLLKRRPHLHISATVACFMFESVPENLTAALCNRSDSVSLEIDSRALPISFTVPADRIPSHLLKKPSGLQQNELVLIGRAEEIKLYSHVGTDNLTPSSPIPYGNLTVLDVSPDFSESELITLLCNCQRLCKLSLSDCNLTKSLFECFSSTLTQLILNDCVVAENCTPASCSFMELERLSIKGNKSIDTALHPLILSLNAKAVHIDVRIRHRSICHPVESSIEIQQLLHLQKDRTQPSLLFERLDLECFVDSIEAFSVLCTAVKGISSLRYFSLYLRNTQVTEDASAGSMLLNCLSALRELREVELVQPGGLKRCMDGSATFKSISSHQNSVAFEYLVLPPCVSSASH